MVRFFCGPSLPHKGDLETLLCSPMILNPRDVSWLAKTKRKKVKKKFKKSKKEEVKLIDNIQYFSWPVWLISLNIIPSRSIYVIASIRISFLMAE